MTVRAAVSILNAWTGTRSGSSGKHHDEFGVGVNRGSPRIGDNWNRRFNLHSSSVGGSSGSDIPDLV